jgi:hypothetical protein
MFPNIGFAPFYSVPLLNFDWTTFSSANFMKDFEEQKELYL